MLTGTALLLAGLLLLPFGAQLLVNGSSSLAVRLGIAPLVVGLTVVAFATGAPEFAVSVKGAATGNSGIALGNVVGSNISNIALVLGVAAVIKPMQVRARLVRREMPLMLGATVLLCVLLLDGMLGRLDGLLLVTAGVAYTVFAYRGARAGDIPAVSAQFDEAIPQTRLLGRDLGLIIGGVPALVAGAELLVSGAVTVAGGLGVDQAVIALTVIAIGTSLPELATSVAAARKEQADVAFGNVIGSNTLNILAVLGITALIHPFAVEGLRLLDFGVLVATAVLVLPMMIRGWVLNRAEGLLLVAVYGLYLASLVG
ncbi:MAG: calcium/sodium antiporter [Coriobacteriia bacterium]|nr:calcium/sodium antiporter [Coriobacteriia bacterium]